MDILKGVKLSNLKEETKSELFDINEVMTVNEASKTYGKSEGTIRWAIKHNKFIKGKEYRKSGRITLITKSAMERVYKEK